MIISISKKSQTWSFDLLLGLTAFMVVFIMIYGYITYSTRVSDAEILKRDSQLILASVEAQNNQIGFIENNQVIQERLFSVSDTEGFEKLKSSIGARNNFCIFLEDEDGKLLNMRGEPADIEADQVGIGDGSLDNNVNLKINGVPCGYDPAKG